MADPSYCTDRVLLVAMAPWFVLLKPVLPALGNVIADAVVQKFTKPKPKATADEVAAQLAELQNAATGNAEAIKVVAEQLERTVKAIEQGATTAEERVSGLQRQIKTLRALLVIVGVMALVALVLGIVAMVRQ
jgi:hypothetical protein